MRLVALYKTWDGEEWIATSLASIYDSVDAIVLMHSDRSWLGEIGNTCEAAAVAWCQQHDTERKVHHIACSTSSQEEQYAIGLACIDSLGLRPDVVMVVDADEIWSAADIGRARQQIAADKLRHPAYRCSMHTYLKTPFYQVDPPYGEPLCFFRAGEGAKWLTKRPRGQGCPSGFLSDVWMHHFTYVRESFDAVDRKIAQSSTADGDIRTPHWDDIWKALPFGRDLHGCAQWRHVWQRVRRVWRHEIPAVVWQSECLRTFFAGGDSLLTSEMDAIGELARGTDHCIDLGTLHGNSAVLMSLGADVVDTYDLYEDVPPDAVVHVIDGQTTTFADWVGPTEAATRKRLEWYSNVRANKQDVIAAAGNHCDGAVDLVFVDADHAYECTIGCARAWLPKIKPGGILLFHDYCNGNPGVQKAVDEIRAEPALQQFTLPTQWPGSLVGFHKQ